VSEVLLDGAAGLERLQPEVPLGLVMVRSKPPMNAPQVTADALSRSPIFFPPSCTVVPVEQTSPVGSRSPTSVPGPVLFGTTLALEALGAAG